MFKDSNSSLFIGSHVVKLPSCHSTNQVASDLLADPSTGHGTVVITDNQTKGRGQRGNIWESQPGKNLTCSIILKPTFLEVERQFDLNILASLAISQTLHTLGLTKVSIKWPNDIYCNEAKIAGILIENTIRSSRLESSVVGIGLNVNQQEFSVPNATSILMQSGESQLVEVVLQNLLQNLQHLYQTLAEGGHQELKQQYLAILYRYRQRHQFKDLRTNSLIEGSIQGIDHQGRLLLLTKEGDLSFGFKEIQFL